MSDLEYSSTTKLVLIFGHDPSVDEHNTTAGGTRDVAHELEDFPRINNADLTRAASIAYTHGASHFAVVDIITAEVELPGGEKAKVHGLTNTTVYNTAEVYRTPPGHDTDFYSVTLALQVRAASRPSDIVEDDLLGRLAVVSNS
jgi:hypothetical protein